MRLRRLEFVVIGITLAFACFMGGFFTGRSWSAVNVVAVATQNDESYGVGISVSSQDVIREIPDTVEVNRVQEVPQVPSVSSEANEPAEVIGAPKGGDGKININLASQSELTDLPGIGNVLASRIVDYRRQYGDFSRIEDLRNVSGIGEKRYEAIQDKITIG